MDIEKFIEKRHPWAETPCLYIVKQIFEGNVAYRCGMAGGSLYADSDRPYNTGSKSGGLTGRLNMYKNFWLPMKGKIYAAMRIPAKLANVTGTLLGGSLNTQYSINQGNKTLVKIREADFHATLDSRNLRWDKDKKNELFEPKKSVEELIACLRTVESPLNMYIFNSEGPIIDPAYRGGSRRKSSSVVSLQKRQTPRSSALGKDYNQAAPTVEIRLSKKNVALLRSDDPQKYELLLSLVNIVKGL